MKDRNREDLGWNHAVNRPKTKAEARVDGAIAAIKLAAIIAILLAVILGTILS